MSESPTRIADSKLSCVYAVGPEAKRGGWCPTIVAGFAAGLFCLAPCSLRAQPLAGRAGGITEYDLKAAYLYNFTRYIDWPQEAFGDARSPFVIGVLGDDPLRAALDEVARRKMAQGRKIVIRRFKSWKDYQPCHLLFLPRTVENGIKKNVITRTRGSPLLLVGETPGLARRGATVNFYPDINGTIGFEINVDATTERNLQVDARLLKLARVVRSSPQPGSGS